ncbi:MAG: chloride channel protein, partial [Pirellulaceae bacterium]
MFRDLLAALRDRTQAVIRKITHRGMVPAMWLTIALACLIGVVTGCGAAAFTILIETVSESTVLQTLDRAALQRWWNILLLTIPALGLLFVSWFTRRFAPEAQGHGVPEVIVAVARHDGIIRPRVSVVKILASAITIGTGGSVGREGPIVQIGSTVGSMFGQWFRLSARNIKVLVAAGAAAGISATFNAPLAGVIFASEIILGSFVAESLVPIVIASVVADVVQIRIGEHGLEPAFRHLTFSYEGAWGQLPGYFVLGIICGLAAVLFTKLLYAVEDLSQRMLPKWWVRAIVLGLVVGVAGVAYPRVPPTISPAVQQRLAEGHELLPPLFGVGYGVVDHAVHLTNDDFEGVTGEHVQLSRGDLLRELWWLLPLVFLKPLMTSITLGGGGSGGIFAPSLFIGATVGASFGVLCNLFVPGVSAHPGVYAIVGMGAVVAGTTHGVLSAILIVYEMTDQDSIILPIMIAAGLASVVARLIDRESIYHKKLSRRGETIARGHEMHYLEHIMVRDVMLRQFPTVNQNDDVNEIIRVARSNPTVESLPVMNPDGHLIGIIRPEDLHRVLDSDVPPHLIQAEDIALKAPLSVSPDENLLEAIRDFGSRDVETLPVEVGSGKSRRLVGLLLRADVMRRYREEMLSA